MAPHERRVTVFVCLENAQVGANVLKRPYPYSCVCIHTRPVCGCMCIYDHMCLEARDQHQVFSAITLYLLLIFYFTQGLSLNLELTEPFPMNARTDLWSLCLCCKHLTLDLRTFILFIQTMPDPLSLERLSDPWRV